MPSTKDSRISVHIVISKEDNEWTAHCLEFDIVAVAKTRSAVEKDIIDLIKAQIKFAVENDNLENLFTPAAPEAWAKLVSHNKCQERPFRASQHSPVAGAQFCFA